MARMSIFALILCSVSLVIFIIAFAIPYWTRITEKSVGQTVYTGLWLACVRFADDTTTCKAAHFDLEPDWFKAVQAMEILGFLFGVLGLVMSCISTFVKKNNNTLKKGTAAVSFIVAVFIMIGVIIYGVKTPGNGKYLHAGFGLAVVASAGFGLSSILMCLDKSGYDSIP